MAEVEIAIAHIVQEKNQSSVGPILLLCALIWLRSGTTTKMILGQKTIPCFQESVYSGNVQLAINLGRQRYLTEATEMVALFVREIAQSLEKPILLLCALIWLRSGIMKKMIVGQKTIPYFRINVYSGNVRLAINLGQPQ